MGALVGKRILLVEDEVLVALLAEDMLTSQGAIVVGPAHTVSAGLAPARSENLDAAVLDVHIEGETSDGIAALLAERRVPFIRATGYGGLSKEQDGMPILDKPYTSEKLEAAILQAMNRRWAH